MTEPQQWARLQLPRFPGGVRRGLASWDGEGLWAPNPRDRGLRKGSQGPGPAGSIAECLLCARQAHSAPHEHRALGGLAVPTGPMRKRPGARGSVPWLGSRGLVRPAFEVSLTAAVP